MEEPSVPVDLSPPKMVTAREFQNRPGLYLDMALREPVMITKNGRPRNVVLSVEEFERLKKGRRRATMITPEEAAEMIAALRAMEIPAEAALYNDECRDDERSGETR